MPLHRRTLLTAAALSLTRHAAAEPAVQTIALWPTPPPGGPAAPERLNAKRSITNIATPRLRLYGPPAPNGTAALVIAGGGYAHIEAGTESTPACQWLQSLGTTAFELIYRLPREGWPTAAPFQDAQRAMRLIRALAPTLPIDPARIGIIGFSAGGHLAGMTAVRHTPLYQPIDPADALSARPAFCALLYPVLTMMPPWDTTRSRRELIGTHPSTADSEAYSVERLVDAQTPPTFLAQSQDDPISPIANTTLMTAALHAAHIPVETHIFQTGGHGWGMGRPGTEPQAWPGLFQRWAAASGFPLSR